MTTATLTYTFTAGALVRGSIKRQIIERAWLYGLHVEVQEAKSFTTSTYRFVMTGEPSKVNAFGRDLAEWEKVIQSPT